MVRQRYPNRLVPSQGWTVIRELGVLLQGDAREQSVGLERGHDDADGDVAQMLLGGHGSVDSFLARLRVRDDTGPIGQAFPLGHMGSGWPSVGRLIGNRVVLVMSPRGVGGRVREGRWELGAVGEPRLADGSGDTPKKRGNARGRGFILDGSEDGAESSSTPTPSTSSTSKRPETVGSRA